jgi:hypothetical protein
MDIYTSLKIECAKAGISLRQMCLQAGVRPDILSDWKKKEPKSITMLRELRKAIKELDKNNTSDVNTELDDVC